MEEKNNYRDEFVELWPEQRELIDSVLTSLEQNLSGHLYQQYCEHIREFILKKDQQSLRLSINLARRMTGIAKGELPSEVVMPGSDPFYKQPLLLGLAVILVAIALFYLYPLLA